MSDYDETNEKRKLKRRHLIYYLRVFDATSGELIGHLVDVTQEGIMLISETAIESNKIFQMRMDLPTEYWGTKHLDFEAKSLWSAHDINPDFYNSGFELHNVDWKVIDTVQRLINQYGFRD